MFGGTLGSHFLGHGRCRLRVWAPGARRVEAHFVAPEERWVALHAQERGYFETIADGVGPGWQYYYRLDGGAEWPDPASRYQPEGIHGPSQIIDPNFEWHDQNWRAPALERFILYELHVGTFSPEGTFEGIIPYLDHLREIGITALELMPVAQFPGRRNWGYDGAFLFAAQDSYDGPDGLRRLVDACHARGLAVVLDVVYNHFGPEGCVYRNFSEDYFTSRYRTPWGEAINFDGPGSDEVRACFIENALYWTRDCHIDALRLDAIHAIKDFSAIPFLEQLGEAVHEAALHANRNIYVIAESDLNDPRVIERRERGGMGLDAQWSDDFHHALHAQVTGERAGYYADFIDPARLLRAWTEGFAVAGDYSEFRGCTHGRSSRGLPGERFIVFSQNHDQVGNRMLGERLVTLVPEAARLAAAMVLLSPHVPLLFMGEEYGETAPFLYFTSHLGRELAAAVRVGRAEEFRAFAWAGDVPDPQSESTFEESRLNHALRRQKEHRQLEEFYGELIRLRTSVPALARLDKESQEVMLLAGGRVLVSRRWAGESQTAAIFNVSHEKTAAAVGLPEGKWKRILDGTENASDTAPGNLESKGERIKIPLPPYGLVVYEKAGA